MLRVAEKLPHLRHLELSGCRNITDKGLVAVAGRCRNLQAVALRHCYRLTEAGLIQLVAGSGAHLRTLNFKDLAPAVSDAVLLQIANNCRLVRLAPLSLPRASPLPQLNTLNLSGALRTTDAGVKAVAEQCRSLRSVNASGCCAVTLSASSSAHSACFR